MHVPELYGAVLCGGQSRRMGRDKGQLDYGQGRQAEAVYQLLSMVNLCQRTFISCRADQQSWYEPLPQIHDTYDAIGPLGGLLSVMEAFPQQAWLAVACDMPGLSADTLQCLISTHQSLYSITPQHAATENPVAAIVFSHSDTADIYNSERFEPLCAIYEPAAYVTLKSAYEQGDFSLFKALKRMPIRTVSLSDPAPLLNINTPAEAAAYRAGDVTAKRPYDIMDP